MPSSGHDSPGSTSRLPPFLQSATDDSSGNQTYQSAVFPESDDIRPVNVHWWPCKVADAIPQTVFFFVPGNPGIIDFYPPFLNEVYSNDTSGRLAILIHSHVGHAPSLDSQYPLHRLDSSQLGLTCQIQNVLRVIDAVKSTFGQSVNIVLAGHSVGAWLALQAFKLRPGATSGVFLLFPTIAEIAGTPNGRKLSWLFRAPVPRVTANIARAVYYMPTRLLGTLFPSYPLAPLHALRSFLRLPQAIFASMTMAHDEMLNIRQLDSELLNEHRDKIWFYFAQNDDWVGKSRDTILRTFKGDEAHIVHGGPGVPHAFCINHSEEVARQCYQWLVSAGFVDRT
ncbi:hypothetical protein HYDPIDRAFT_106369 [Hydnomerulius pinastri MD-312]|nr:hypothetical protein HYDPIDRAFT_106369 [Hydnomerulius pinastri MD-312]